MHMQTGTSPGARPGQSDGLGEVARRHIRTPETKEFFKTSEFVIWFVTIVGILIAGAISENLFSNLVWILITATSFAYIVSRGIAKAGAKRGWGEVPPSGASYGLER
jgi:hypothetical protein